MATLLGVVSVQYDFQILNNVTMLVACTYVHSPKRLN